MCEQYLATHEFVGKPLLYYATNNCISTILLYASESLIRYLQWNLIHTDDVN